MEELCVNGACPNCGAKMRQYKFSLNRQIVDVLKRMYNFHGSGTSVEIASLNMTTSQWTNFQKLKYWDLIERVKTGKGGVWKVTPKGEAFILNQLQIPKYAIMYRNELVEFRGNLIFEKDIKTRKFKTKPEYIADSEPVSLS